MIKPKIAELKFAHIVAEDIFETGSNKKDFKTKQEQKWIKKDTKRVKVVYRNKKYKLLKSANEKE